MCSLYHSYVIWVSCVLSLSFSYNVTLGKCNIKRNLFYSYLRTLCVLLLCSCCWLMWTLLQDLMTFITKAEEDRLMASSKQVQLPVQHFSPGAQNLKVFVGVRGSSCFPSGTSRFICFPTPLAYHGENPAHVSLISNKNISAEDLPLSYLLKQFFMRHFLFFH